MVEEPLAIWSMIFLVGLLLKRLKSVFFCVYFVCSVNMFSDFSGYKTMTKTCNKIILTLGEKDHK